MQVQIDHKDHYPVMLNEMLQTLSVQQGGNYLDCTFGAGGYSRAILSSKDCNVYAVDQDPTTWSFATNLKKEFCNRFNFIQTNFANITRATLGLEFDGIVLDLGMSSMHIDQPHRGFSFMHDGPLDMRMSGEGLSACDFIATASEEKIANVIYQYSDEVQSRAIASNIIRNRKLAKIDSTIQLANIVRSAMHYRKSKIDPATKTFQAIRIHINKELEYLEKFLSETRSLLKTKGRLIVVSFHALEDRIVKNFFKSNMIRNISKYASTNSLTNSLTNQHDSYNSWLYIITKKPMVPTSNEIKLNPRSRSAKLRAAEKA